MKILFLIGSGSFMGGVFRYLLCRLIDSKQVSSFPWATLLVNVTGCFLIGLLFGLFGKWSISHEWKLFLATGLLGGFTTFSAFSNETYCLINQGQILTAMGYILSSILFGLMGTFAGYMLIKTCIH